jgi:hypothetical protein
MLMEDVKTAAAMAQKVDSLPFPVQPAAAGGQSERLRAFFLLSALAVNAAGLDILLKHLAPNA